MEIDPMARGMIPVILNPAARSMRAAAWVERIRTLSPRVRVCETAASGDARRMARELAVAGASVVVAAGGDGTMNEVVNGLAEAPVDVRPALGLLPAGTMNVLARELGLPARRPDDCWRIIEAGHSREIDLWRANDVFFAQLAGVGLDAMVVERTSWESKRRLGPISYLRSLVGVLSEPAPVVSVRIDDAAPILGTAALVGNGSLYGGPFRAFPGARNDDGLIEVLVLHRHGLAELSSLLVDVVAGRHGETNGYSRRRARSVQVTTGDSIPFEVDGELAGHGPVEIRPAGFPLRVLVPDRRGIPQ